MKAVMLGAQSIQAGTTLGYGGHCLPQHMHVTVLTLQGHEQG